MPNETHPNPTTLDYQPVTKDRRRIPTWLVVFVVGFGVGAVWVPASMGYNLDPLWEWVVVTIYPALVIGEVVYNAGASHLTAWVSCCVTLGLSYGLVALLGYCVYRRLRQWLTTAV